jgi:hypothetical protein
MTVNRQSRSRAASALRHTQLVMAVAALVFLAGCASERKPPQSGFLGEYPRMVPSKRAVGAYVWVHPQKNVADYYHFIIDPVTVYFHADARGREVGSADAQQLADYFRQEMQGRILESGAYKIVEQPGGGVLRIRAAITDVVPSRVGVNATPGLRSTGAGVGGASMEAEFIDTGTNERIAAVIATRRGNPAKIREGRSRWGYTQDVLSEWAQIIREALDDRWVTDSFGNTRR